MIVHFPATAIEIVVPVMAGFIYVTPMVIPIATGIAPVMIVSTVVVTAVIAAAATTTTAASSKNGRSRAF